LNYKNIESPCDKGIFLYKEILNKKTVLRKGMMDYGKKRN